MKARVIAGSLTALLAAWAVCAGVRCHRDEHSSLDGVSSCYLSGLFREDTEYAPGYSTAAFRRLRHGMAKDEVLVLLGPPLDRYPVDGGREGWRWTRSPGDRSYRVRVALFTNDRVSKVLHHL